MNRDASENEGSDFNPMWIVQFAFLLAIIAGLCYFGYQQYQNWNDPLGFNRAAAKLPPAAASTMPTITLPEGKDAAFGANP